MQSYGLPVLVLVMVSFQARVWANAHQRSLPTNMSITPHQGARGLGWEDICGEFSSISAQTSCIQCLKDLIECSQVDLGAGTAGWSSLDCVLWEFSLPDGLSKYDEEKKKHPCSSLILSVSWRWWRWMAQDSHLEKDRDIWPFVKIHIFKHKSVECCGFGFGFVFLVFFNSRHDVNL